MPAIAMIQIFSAIIYIIVHPQENEMGITLQKTAHTVSASLGLILVYLSITCRETVSYLLQTTDQMAKESLTKRRHLKYRRQQNLIYLGTWLTLVLSIIPLNLLPVPIVVETFKTGQLHFKKFLPIYGSPFSVVNYVQAFLDYFTYSYINWFSLFYLSIICGIFLQISVRYQVLADDLRDLRNCVPINEDEQFLQLKYIIQEYQMLKGQVK